MAEDSLGKLHISSWYSNGSIFALRLTDNISGSFVGQNIESDPGLPKGISSSLAIDSQDKRHILYLDRDGNTVKYATDKYGSWDISIIGEYPGDEEENFITAITIDSNDKIHGAYYGSTTLGGPCEGLCYVH